MGGEFRAGVFILLLGGKFDEFPAVRRIYSGSADGQQIAAHIFLNHIGDGAKAANGLAVYRRIAGGCHRIHTAVLRCGEISDQDIASARICGFTSLYF